MVQTSDGGLAFTDQNRFVKTDAGKSQVTGIESSIGGDSSPLIER